ncbi:tumor necrosis factor receptor superfamily member 1B-like [Asterias rubens]|uniref:tumor necrosis factor receptor superfamily member 1B-like n=1 Tax=Asterias rubens TaxID=7604 RepID=UPI001455384C|nr:tumor necrosis factor receptor superfamily member 1B-like [Asterias rubens]
MDLSLALFVCSVMVMFVMCINADTDSYSEAAQKGERSTTASRYILGPDGQMSVLRDKFDPDKRYKHDDANGICCCGLCNPGQYVRSFCTCSAVPFDIEPQQITKCQRVDYGFEYMDRPNNSTVPYKCTEMCKANQEKTSDCTPNADITCQCIEGWFNPNDSGDDNIPSECRRIPGCRAGEEPIRQVSNDVVTYTCQQCPQGYFKLEGNSTKSCEPHRVCETRPGSRTSDVVCLNDDFGPSDRNTVSSTTTSPPTQGTQPRLDEITTPSNSQGKHDTQTTTKTPELTGKPVQQFGYETAFVAAVIVIVLLIVTNVVLTIILFKTACKRSAEHQQVLPVAYAPIKLRWEEAELKSIQTQTV